MKIADNFRRYFKKHRFFFALLFASILSYIIPFAVNMGRSGRFDFDHFEVFYQILAWWHEIGDYSVQWNPYLCGGATLVGDPQMPLFHPVMFSYLLFAPATALKVTIIFWVIAGFLSMYLLARELKLSKLYASLAAFCWVLNGYFSSHTGVMHFGHLAGFLFPLFLFLNMRYASNLKAISLILIPPVLMTSIVSSPHYIWFCLPFVCFHFLFEAIANRIRPRFFFCYILAVVTGFGLSAFFLLPAYYWQLDFPKNTMLEFVRPWYLPISMLYPGKITFFLRNGRGPHEFIFFLGPVLLFLFFLSFRLHRKIKSFYPLILIFSLSYVMGWGSFKILGSPIPSPFDLVKSSLPGFQAVQVPTRFWIALLPTVILFAFLVLQFQLSGPWKGWKTSWKVLLFAFLLAPLWFYNLYTGLRLFGFTPKERNPHIYRHMPYQFSNEFSYRDYEGTMMDVIRPNTGIRNCYQGLQIPTAKNLENNHSLLLMAPEGTRLKRPSWDQIILEFPEPLREKQIIRINQNHHHNWKIVGKSNPSRIVSRFYEVLALETESGTRKIELRYRDPSWPLAVKISLSFFAIWLLLSIWSVLVTCMNRRKCPVKNSCSG